MEVRKIQSVGKGSYSISLPKEWIVHNHLKEKDFVSIESLDNRLIIDTGGTKSGKNSSVSVDYQKIKKLKEFIRMCYIKGIDNIKISFSNKKDKELSKIRDILERKTLNFPILIAFKILFDQTRMILSPATKV